MAGNATVGLPKSGETRLKEEPRGLFGEILAFLGSIARYLQILAALAGEESREALALGLRFGVMLIAALFFAGFGYVLLVVSAAFFAAHFLGVSWFWILGGFAALHLILAVFCAWRVKAFCKTPLFEATRREISNDLEALRKNQRP